MKRNAATYLTQWSTQKDRKPLILRGARQVGKTYLVREWAKSAGYVLTELNLDLEKKLHSLFLLEPSQILRELAAIKGDQILHKNALFFIDEIQACPAAISALRYFKELTPELPVIAAGSLLDFALKDISSPMPVGRVEFLYIYPLSFQEFLLATEGLELARYLSEIKLGHSISEAVDARLIQSLRNYFFVGGMPEVVETYINTTSIEAVQRTQSAIIQTFEADFMKYGEKHQQELLPIVFRRLVGEIGKKVKYSRISSDHRSPQIKRIIELLELAGIVHRIRRTAANRVPLGAEVDDAHFKLIILDIGLAHHMAGLRLFDYEPRIIESLLTAMEGAMAEQFVGQELLANHQFYERKLLYYWHREAKNSNAEVDYLEALGERIVPCEVKAGKGSTLRSLQRFLEEKGTRLGVRLSGEKLSKEQISLPSGAAATLINLPLYCAGRVAGRDSIELPDPLPATIT